MIVLRLLAAQPLKPFFLAATFDLDQRGSSSERSGVLNQSFSDLFGGDRREFIRIAHDGCCRRQEAVDVFIRINGISIYLLPRKF
jgi:hypothetical protein